MVMKKIGSAALLIGGLLSTAGIVIAIVISATNPININGQIGMMIMARIGAIITFVGSILAVAGACKDNLKKGGAITSLVFGILMFVAQMLIDPFTSYESYTISGLFGDIKPIIAATIGMLYIGIFGIVLFIMGIVGLAKKSKKQEY